MKTKQSRKKYEFSVGDRIYDKKYGFGTVMKTDLDNSKFPYLVHYENHGGRGGTKIWYQANHAVPASEAGTLAEEV